MFVKIQKSRVFCVSELKALGVKFNIKDQLSVYEPFLTGKFARIPLLKKSSRNTKVLEILHTGICGPMSTQSRGEARYFATFIEDSRRWCEVELKFLKHKNDILEAFNIFNTVTKNQTERKIKIVQSDNRKEYCSKEFG